MTHNVEKLTADDFARVNKLVDEYNSKKDDYAQGPYGGYFESLPQLSHVLPPGTAATGTAGASSDQYIYDVWVFKYEGGQWAKQPDYGGHDLDAKTAAQIANTWRSLRGWTSTTNAPGVSAQDPNASAYLFYDENAPQHQPSYSSGHG